MCPNVPQRPSSTSQSSPLSSLSAAHDILEATQRPKVEPTARQRKAGKLRSTNLKERKAGVCNTRLTEVATTLGKTKLRNAVRCGIVPKARNAFAIFAGEQFAEGKAAGGPLQAHFKVIAEKWKSLDEDTREKFKAKALEEFKDLTANATDLSTWGPIGGI